jgi:hypothetical protein
MRIATAAFALSVACGGTVLQATAVPLSFRIPVPANVESKQTHLLFLGVATPQDRPVILRAYGVGPDTSQMYLGSTALPGLSPDALGTRTVDTLRVNVTPGLRAWRTVTGSRDSIEIQIKAFTSGSVPFGGTWSVRSVRLVHPQ